MTNRIEGCYIICLGLALCIVMSCKEADNDMPLPQQAIHLTSPVNKEVVEYCCFFFQWETVQTTSGFQFILSTDRFFNEVLVDTSLDVNQFRLEDKLYPAQDYYWKVSLESLEAEAIDSFQVKDYAAYFTGSYPVDVVIEDWDFVNGVTWDTLYPGVMDISKVSVEEVKIFEHTTGKSRMYDYMPSIDFGDSTVVYMYNDVSRTSFCTFNFVLNTFSAGVTEGGVGSRRYYYFSGHKP